MSASVSSSSFHRESKSSSQYHSRLRTGLLKTNSSHCSKVALMVPIVPGLGFAVRDRTFKLLATTGVGVEKVTSISGMRFGRSMLEESDLTHALLDFHHRRTADHDGATRPLRSAVLLLPTGRSGSRDALAAAHR